MGGGVKNTKETKVFQVAEQTCLPSDLRNNVTILKLQEELD